MRFIEVRLTWIQASNAEKFYSYLVYSQFRRVDAMDKIVSPVVPQPGAWKRPPRTIPTGARKGSRLRSTSVSENELVSPTDDTKTFDSEYLLFPCAIG